MSLLSLKQFGPEHFARLASWFENQQQVTQWAGSGPSFPLTTSQLAAMVQETQAAPPARYCWMAVKGDDFVGHCQVALDWQNGVARLARVAIAPQWRGKGLARAMLTRVLDETFSNKEFDRIELNVFGWNTAAIKTYSGLGFVHEGTRRASVTVGSERWDTAMMGLLRHEWEAAPQVRPHE
jgi:RimJ/RimL family protein N-acetyltransferase